MNSSHATHPGLIRKNNEDFIRTDDERGIYLLADGIGGHNAGEVASSLAVDTAYGVVRSNLSHTDVDGFFELMVHAMQTAHWEVSTKALTNQSFTRMGTTLVIAVVRDNKAYIVHAGDSRCYLFKNAPPPSPGVFPEDEGKSLFRITNDHTVGVHLLASGVAIGQIPKKKFHTLTQSVGCGNPPYPDFKIVDLNPSDLLLICSDGLTDMLSDVEIESILAHEDASLDSLAADLIDAANRNGGKDNISVVLISPS